MQALREQAGLLGMETLWVDPHRSLPLNTSPASPLFGFQLTLHLIDSLT